MDERARCPVGLLTRHGQPPCTDASNDDDDGGIAASVNIYTTT